jgi:DUF4097 and DUF4098 domain-containing protein YvlB
MLSSGCIVISAGGWGCGARAWTETQSERVSLDPGQLKSIDAKTHNGAVSFEALDAGMTESYVMVTKRAGGATSAEAERAMEALEIFAEPDGEGTRLGYRWRGTKGASWQAQVSFEINAPGETDFVAETHNGSVKAVGMKGSVSVETHNGWVSVGSENGPLYAETHNGSINVSYAGPELTLLTHNGQITADLSKCTVVNGAITTHNGGVAVTVGNALSATIDCRTHNGRIACDVPTTATEARSRRVVATIGSGDGGLELTTHNGSVRVKKSDG